MMKMMIRMMIMMVTTAVTTQAVIPDMQVELSTAAINYVGKQLLRRLAEMGRTYTVGGGTIYNNSDNSITAKFSNLRVESLAEGSSKMTFNSQSQGIAWHVADISARIKFDWEYSAFHRVLFDYGCEELTIDEASIDVEFGINIKDESLHFNMRNCDVSVADLTFATSATPSHVGWIYNIVLNLADFKTVIKNNFCQVIKHDVQEANKKLESWTDTVNRPSKYLGGVSVHLVSYKMSESKLLLDFQLQLWQNGHPVYYNNVSDVIVDPVQLPSNGNTHMCRIYITENIINNVFIYQHKDAPIKTRLTKYQMDPDKRYILNTTCPRHACIGNFFYKLKETYPDGSIIIDIVATRAPLWHLYQNVVTLNCTARLDFTVQTTNGTFPVFSATVDVLANLMPKYVEAETSFTLAGLSFNTTNVQSSIGEISGNAMSYILQTLSANLMIPYCNRALENFHLIVAKLTSHCDALYPYAHLIQGGFMLETNITCSY